MEKYWQRIAQVAIMLSVIICGYSQDERLGASDEADRDQIRADMDASNSRRLSRHIPPKSRDKNSAVPEFFYTAPLNSNPHDFNYMINQPRLCMDNKEVLLLVMVRSTFPHYDRRMAMRETWAMQEIFKDRIVKFVFLFAAPADSGLQRAIQRESEIYDDIVQEDFDESYLNLTLKTVMAWKWVTTYCSHAYYVMVGDDSIVVDIHKLLPYLIKHLSSTTYEDHFMLCYLFPCCTRAIHSRSKYAISNGRYPGSAFPAYCSGTGYIASSDIIEKLYLMSLDTPSFMPDDAWTGVIVEKLGLKYLDTYTAYAGVSMRESLMGVFLNESYKSSPVMVGILDHQFPGKEASMMRAIWRTIIQQHQRGYKAPNKFPRGKQPDPSSEEQTRNVWTFAVLLMCVDVGVIFVIFVAMFWRKKR